MSYAIIGFGKIGQALAQRLRPKEHRRGRGEPPAARGVGTAGSGDRTHGRRQVAARRARGRHDHLGGPVRGASAKLRRPCRTGKARRSSTRRTRSECRLRSWTASRPPPSPRKAFTGAKLVKGFNHLAAAALAADPIVEGGHRVVFLSSDDEDATAPVAALAKQLGFAPVQLGQAQRGRLAGARTRPHLGSAHLPGSGQEGAVVDLRPCGWDRVGRSKCPRSDTLRCDGH